MIQLQLIASPNFRVLDDLELVCSARQALTNLMGESQHVCVREIAALLLVLDSVDEAVLASLQQIQSERMASLGMRASSE